MFTIGDGKAQILRTVVASQLLGRKLPQRRDAYHANPKISPESGIEGESC